MKIGFLNADEYKKAILKGFIHYLQFLEALEGSFDDPKEYEEAIGLGISNIDEYNFYLELKEIQKDTGLETLQEAIIYKKVEGLSIGEKINVSDLWEEIKEESVILDKKIPSWYTRNFVDKKLFIDFLTSNENINTISIYDSEIETLERINYNPFLKYKIILDGSNVSWGMGSKEAEDRPLLKNLLLVREALENNNFKNIVIFADANLRHQIDDRERYKKLLKEKKVQETPAKTDADEFIIQYMKEMKAFVITNDTFTEWRGRDDWLDENFDYYRIPFMIYDDIVKLKGNLEYLK